MLELKISTTKLKLLFIRQKRSNQFHLSSVVERKMMAEMLSWSKRIGF
jgi:hypothetical protein